MDLKNVITPSLQRLHDVLTKRDHGLWFVGGMVRDLLLGIEPKDVDLCTTATPEQMIAIFTEEGIRFEPTGLQHGTLTVIIDGEVYEITTLRIDTDQDGRHATVVYTTDLILDLGRRDLTINAMAMDFDGNLIDPFNGAQDLTDKRIRFVGNPDDRMREDYLRILRWLRFHDRIATGTPLDADTVAAARRNADGLRKIKRERVWMEMAKIVSGNNGPLMLHNIYAMQLADCIGLPALYRRTGDVYPDCPPGGIDRMMDVAKLSSNPVTRLVAVLRNEATHLPIAWKWSAEERDLCIFLAERVAAPGFGWKHMLAVSGVRREWVLELAYLRGGREGLFQAIRDWDVPMFPLKGGDLIAEKGYKPGPIVGETVKHLKHIWATTEYLATREELLRLVVTSA